MYIPVSYPHLDVYKRQELFIHSLFPLLLYFTSPTPSLVFQLRTLPNLRSFLWFCLGNKPRTSSDPLSCTRFSPHTTRRLIRRRYLKLIMLRISTWSSLYLYSLSRLEYHKFSASSCGLNIFFLFDFFFRPPILTFLKPL